MTKPANLRMITSPVRRLCWPVAGESVGSNHPLSSRRPSPQTTMEKMPSIEIAALADRLLPVRHKVVAITRSALLSCVRPIPRGGLSRDEAAMYIGISATKFDELVRDGRMPGPKRIDARKVWDVRDLDVAFDALPSENPASQESTWDDFRAP